MSRRRVLRLSATGSRTRRLAAASVAAVIAVTAVCWVTWTGTARATAQIGEKELRDYPPIVLVFGPCCVGTQAGASTWFAQTEADYAD